jgi:hypothetical protein
MAPTVRISYRWGSDLSFFVCPFHVDLYSENELVKASFRPIAVCDVCSNTWRRIRLNRGLRSKDPRLNTSA